MKKFKILFFFLVFFTSYELRVTSYELYAQDENKLTALSRQVIEAKTGEELYPAFEELKELYFSAHKYPEFVEFLQSLEAQKKALGPFAGYYIALSRYRQLKYLEEAQAWDEYFSQGNTYRDQLVLGAQKAINATTAKDRLNIHARLLLWQFHNDQQDAFHEQALSDLMSAGLEHSKEAGDLKTVKDAAELLSARGEKGKAKELYRVYIERLASSPVKDEELLEMAGGFYKEGNLDLSELLYDVYIDRAAKAIDKEKLIPALAGIARQFSRSADPFYAEKVFKKMEEIGVSKGFDEELTYLRAFNLEKIKEYGRAKDAYLDLCRRFPGSVRADEANYKAGIIYTYILRDMEAGKEYFKKLSVQAPLGPQAASSLYQLGLLSQWQEDFAKAREYYAQLIAAAGSGFTENVTPAKERLKEIDEAKPMEYNLRTFLDVSLKGENAFFEASKIDLKALPPAAEKNEAVDIICAPPAIASGCMEVAVQYLWSGNLGSGKPAPDEPAFNTSYAESGTKEINLVVVSPSGIIDRNIILVDIR